MYLRWHVSDKGTVTNVDDDPMDDASDVYDHDAEEGKILVGFGTV